MKRLRSWSLLCLALLASPGAYAAAPLRQVILVQNSGWMEPFYADPQSAFKPLVTQLGNAVAGSNEVVVGLFNQADSLHPSPEWIYRGPGSHPGLGLCLDSAQLASKHSGAYAYSDF